MGSYYNRDYLDRLLAPRMSDEKKKPKDEFREMRQSYKDFCRRHHLESGKRGMKFGRQTQPQDQSVSTSNPSPE